MGPSTFHVQADESRVNHAIGELYAALVGQNLVFAERFERGIFSSESQRRLRQLALGLCAIGFGLASLTGWRGSGILVVTALTVTLATALPGRFAKLSGAEVLGTFLMQIFFAVIGASANVLVVMKVGPVLFVFAALILTIHLIFLLLAGWLLRLDLSEMIITSNANMGGPTTAAAMAVARRWETLVLPAILCGTLGYAGATFIGVALGHWLKS